MTCCVPTWDWHDAEVTMDQVRSDAGEWRFSVHWQCFSAKGRSPYSPFFTTAQLAQFGWWTMSLTVRGLRKLRRTPDHGNSAYP